MHDNAIMNICCADKNSNKRTFTEQFVDYVKRRKLPRCLPCTSPIKSSTSLKESNDDDQDEENINKENVHPPLSITQEIKPKIKEKLGSLCIAFQTTDDLLTFHVIRARQLRTPHTNESTTKILYDTFVKLTIPASPTTPKYEQYSKIVKKSDSPVYDQKFEIPLSKHTSLKRLTISVYNQLSNSKEISVEV
ncbi:unnamed protein product, partial [Didymodactylos carnosus]